MNRRHNIYRLILLGLFLAAFVVLNVVLVGGMIYKEHKIEQGFQQQFPDTWKEHYDQRYGPGSLEAAQARIMAGYVGIPVITLLLWLIYWQVTIDRSGGSDRPHAPRKFRQKNRW